MSNSRSKWLECGCCGTGFETWPEYEDQDQDDGYGICARCQDYIEETNTQAMTSIIRKVRNTLQHDKLAKFDAMSRATQEQFIFKLMDRGAISWQIN